MIEWIEKSGGPAGAAALIAPVIRALFKVTEADAVVRFSTDCTPVCDPDQTDLTVILEADEYTGPEDLYKRLQELAQVKDQIGQVVINGLGCFELSEAGTAASCDLLQGKVGLVTGGAQGFGEGIARELAAAGAYVVIADLNLTLAEQVAASLNEQYGPSAALAIRVDVSQENSVRDLMERITAHYGGLDLLVSNAGVLKAGGLEDMSLEAFEFVTRINYTAFFLVTKYGVRPMKLQSRFDASYSSDVVQINSKSGLEGSNRNFAYAGSKFGGIGLVQSFAKELVEHRIKVNAICPGNYYEGPLWSDAEKGLFVQYLNSGKVPGARSVQDVYDFYVGKVPMHRGCSPADVTKAILYCVQQLYETGQAIPVTGGQNMLK